MAENFLDRFSKINHKGTADDEKKRYRDDLINKVDGQLFETDIENAISADETTVENLYKKLEQLQNVPKNQKDADWHKNFKEVTDGLEYRKLPLNRKTSETEDDNMFGDSGTFKNA